MGNNGYFNFERQKLSTIVVVVGWMVVWGRTQCRLWRYSLTTLASTAHTGRPLSSQPGALEDMNLGIVNRLHPMGRPG